MENNEVMIAETVTEEVAETCSGIGTKNIGKGIGIAAAVAGGIALVAAGAVWAVKKFKKSKTEPEEAYVEVNDDDEAVEGEDEI